MADSKISALPAGAVLTGTEALVAVQSGADVQTTPAALLTYLSTRLGPAAVLTPPVNGDFAWINQGSASVTAEATGIYLSDTTGSGADNFRVRKKSTPAVPYTVTVLLTAIGGTGSVYYGLCWRESSSDKLHAFVFGNQGTIYFLACTSPTVVFNTTASSPFTSQSTQMPPRWMRIADDNTNRICSYSNDGLHFFPIFSTARTTHLTPDEWGFCLNCKPNQASGLFIQSIAEA